ncbi:Tol-Pal system protein TolR [subsurface metagenome]
MIEFEEFNGSLNKGGGPDLTPLLDMVFLLLIFFLLTSFLVLPSIPVALPEAETAEVHEKPDISITIKSDGSLQFNGKPVSDDKLQRSLKRIYTFGQPKEVIIQSDKEVPFGRVIEVMDISKKSGARNISFLVERKQ